MGIIEDITESKRAEEKLRSALEMVSLAEEATDLGSWSWDVNTNEVRWSDSLCRIHGIEPSEFEATFEQGVSFYHPDDADAVIQGIEEMLAEKKPRIFEYRIVTGHGEEKHVRGTNRMVLDEEGEINQITGMVQDITEHKRAEKTRLSNELRMRRLASRLQNVREEERTALARELHDQLGEILTGLKMDLEAIAQLLPATDVELSDRLGNAEHLVETSLTLVQDICQRLRPPVLDLLGLKPAIEWYVSDFSSRYNISCEVRSEDQAPHLSRDGDTAVFRILQEALTNIARHANASEVLVDLSASEDKLVLEVADDGIGITASQLKGVKSFGLLGMSERAEVFGGGVDIRRGTDGGTVVRVTMPLARGQTGIGDLDN